VALQVVVIDNYDSFTYNLVQSLSMLGARCEVLLNDQTRPADVRSRRPDGVLLSPGPGSPREAGVTLDIVRELAGHTPLLGVCLGHQAIGASFGARVQRARVPLHGKAAPLRHDGRGVFRGLPNPLRVGRYHSLVVDGDAFPACLTVTARSEEGEILGLRHRRLPVEGIQFHPESVLTEHGLALLDNWLAGLRPQPEDRVDRSFARW
jgi:anthranilate synthase/aminodeoxychorismate synthase-like glutamine amidotransferase